MISLALTLALPSIVFAQSSPTGPLTSQVEQSSHGIFLPKEFDYGEFAGSIVNVCSDTTTWALQCTASASENKKDVSSNNPSCGSNAPTLTVTEAEDILALSTVTPSGTRSVTVQQSCTINGSDWKATCVGEYAVQGPTPTTHMSTTTWNGPHEFNVAAVTVTAGASKLTASNNCQAYATPTPLANPGAKVPAFCKQLVVPLAMCWISFAFV